MSKTTCGKEMEDCLYFGKPVFCGKLTIKEVLQQCPECYENDVKGRKEVNGDKNDNKQNRF